MEHLYYTWIRIDKTLPWIELKGEYQTRKEARQAAEEAIRDIMVKVVNVPEQRKPIKQLATIRTKH